MKNDEKQGNKVVEVQRWWLTSSLRIRGMTSVNANRDTSFQENLQGIL